MKKNQIAALASKILGIYFAVHSLGYLSALGSQLSIMRSVHVDMSEMFLYSITFTCFAIALGIGLYLVLRAERAAIFLVGPADPAEETPAARNTNMEIIAFAAVGLLLTFQAFPRIVNQALQIWFSQQVASYRQPVSMYNFIDLASSIVQLALGLWLLLGTRGVSLLLKRVRGEKIEEEA